MQKSIFSKYFRICATVVIASILVLGSLFLPFAAKYFTDEKMALLGKGAGAAQRIVLDNYQMNLTGTRVILDSSTIRQGFQMFSESTGAVIYFTDAGGATQLCSEDAPCLHTPYQIPEKVLRALSEEMVSL